jgi:copper transport protein
MTLGEIAVSTGYAMPPLWRILTKTAYFAGLCGAVGFTATHVAVVRPALRDPAHDPADRAVLRRRSETCMAWAGLLLLVTGYFQLAAAVARSGHGMPFGEALAPDRIRAYLSAPATPHAWVAQGTLSLVQNLVLVLAAATLIAPAVPRWRGRSDVLAPLALALSLAIVPIGALPTTAPKTVEALLDTVSVQLHIAAGTTWIGGLVLLVALAGARRALSDRAGTLWADLWRRFGLIALVCVGAVLISGLWMTWEHVGSPAQMWTTAYGLLLLVKILLVVAMVAAGGFNQFWLMPRIARARQADATAPLLKLTLRHFPRVVAAEVALGAGVLAVLPFLTGSARAEAAPSAPPPVATGGIYALGAALALLLAASLAITAKASDALAQRHSVAPDPVDG